MDHAQRSKEEGIGVEDNINDPRETVLVRKVGKSGEQNLTKIQSYFDGLLDRKTNSMKEI